MKKTKKERFLVKGCPFCGGKPMWDGRSSWGYVFIACGRSKCDAVGPVRDTWKRAVRAWNKRPKASSEKFSLDKFPLEGPNEKEVEKSRAVQQRLER